MKRVAAAVAVASAFGTWFGAVEPAAAHVSCPRADRLTVTTDAGAVLRAAKRLVPREYASLRSMGHVAWRHFKVHAVVSLGRTSVVRQPAAGLRALARRVCGSAAADKSWAVVLQFPECQLPCSEDVAFLADEPRGWRIWYSEFHRP